MIGKLKKTVTEVGGIDVGDLLDLARSDLTDVLFGRGINEPDNVLLKDFLFDELRDHFDSYVGDTTPIGLAIIEENFDELIRTMNEIHECNIKKQYNKSNLMWINLIYICLCYLVCEYYLDDDKFDDDECKIPVDIPNAKVYMDKALRLCYKMIRMDFNNDIFQSKLYQKKNGLFYKILLNVELYLWYKMVKELELIGYKKGLSIFVFMGVYDLEKQNYFNFDNKSKKSPKNQNIWMKKPLIYAQTLFKKEFNERPKVKTKKSKKKKQKPSKIGNKLYYLLLGMNEEMNPKLVLTLMSFIDN